MLIFPNRGALLNIADATGKAIQKKVRNSPELQYNIW